MEVAPKVVPALILLFEGLKRAYAAKAAEAAEEEESESSDGEIEGGKAAVFVFILFISYDHF